MMHLEHGGNGSFWADGLPTGVSVTRRFDWYELACLLVSFVICAGYVGYRVWNGDPVYGVIQWMALPFAVCGGLYFCHRRLWLPPVGLAVAAAVMWLAAVPGYLIFVLAYVVVGAFGVAAVVDALQRRIFYRTLQRVRYVNVKQHLSLSDRLTVFLYNIPPDLDTRNLAVDLSRGRRRFPWRTMSESILLSLALGMFFWIYVSMNPSFIMVDYRSSVPLFVFTLMLYIPVLTLPFSVFQSLDARIVTSYRDFRLYSGAVATIQRMAIPVVAALMYVLLAMNQSDPTVVAWYIGLSAAMILLTVGITCVIYFYAMESATVADIGTKWELFMPVPLFSGLGEQERPAEELPGTPVRDEGAFDRLALNQKK